MKSCSCMYEGGELDERFIIKRLLHYQKQFAYLSSHLLLSKTSLSYLSTPWVLTVLATVLLGMIVTTTITLDKSSGWIKTVLTTQISIGTYTDSKYISYLGLSLIGLIFGIIFGYIASTVIGKSNDGVCSVSPWHCLQAIILPFYFLTDETKSILGSIIAYPVSAGVFIGLFLLLGNHLSTYIVIILVVSLAAFIVSWVLTKKYC